MAALPKIGLAEPDLEAAGEFRDSAKIAKQRTQKLLKQAQRLYLASTGRLEDAFKSNIENSLKRKYPELSDFKAERDRIYELKMQEPGYLDKWLEKTKKRFDSDIESGQFGYLKGDIIPSQEQLDKIADPEEKWQYSKLQSIRQALKEGGLSPEQKAQLILHATGKEADWFDVQGAPLDSEVAKRWAKYSGKEWVGAPPQDAGFTVGAGAEMILGPLGPAISNVVETAVKTFQEDPQLQKVPFEKPEMEGTFDLTEHPILKGLIDKQLLQDPASKEALGTLLAAHPLIASAQGLRQLTHFLTTPPDEEIVPLPPIGPTLGEAVVPNIDTGVMVSPQQLVKAFGGGGTQPRYKGIPIVDAIKSVGKDVIDNPEDLLRMVGDVWSPMSVALLAKDIATGKVGKKVDAAGVGFGSTPEEMDVGIGVGATGEEDEGGILRALRENIHAAIPNTFNMDERQQVFRETTRNWRVAQREAGRAWAEEELPGATEEELDKRADKYMRLLRAGDMSFIENPAIAMFVQESAVDPQNWIPGVGVITLAGKAGKGLLRAAPRIAPYVKGVAQLGRKMTQWAHRTPQYVDDFGGDLAARLRAGADMGDTDVERIYQQLESLVGKLPGAKSESLLGRIKDYAWTKARGLPSAALPDEEHALLFTAVLQGETASLPAHLKPHAKTLQELADLRYELQGIGLRTAQKYNKTTGALEVARPLENYVPSSVRAPDAAGDMVRDRYGHLLRKQQAEMELNPFAHAHHKTNTNGALQNVRTQWERELMELQQKGPAYSEMQRTAQILGVEGSSTLDRAFVKEAEDAIAKTEREIIRLEKQIPELGELARKKDLRHWDAIRTAGRTDADKMKEGIGALVRESIRGRGKKLESAAGELGAVIRHKENLEAQLPRLREQLILEKTKELEVEKQLTALSARHGVKYVPLDLVTDDVRLPGGLKIGDVYRRTTMLPGSERGMHVMQGQHVTLVPAPVAQRIRNLSTVLKGEYKDVGLGAWDDFNEVIRPLAPIAGKGFREIQSFWRAAQTLVSPAYYVRNAVGAFGLSTLAHGIKALNPKLQVAAIGASLATTRADDAARATKYLLSGGQETTFGEIIDLARKAGLIDQGTEHMALHGGAVASIMRRAPGTKQALAVNNVIENYQKLVVFMGALKDTSMASVLKASDVTSQFAGNYRRLSKFEKQYLREGFGFYAWNRFIVPRLIKTAADDPQRLMAWMRAHQGMQNYHSEYAPYFSEARPNYGEGYSYASPDQVPSNQPHSQTMEIMETPWSMAAAYKPVFEGLMAPLQGREFKERGPEQLLGLGGALLYSVLASDEKGVGDVLAETPGKMVARGTRELENLKRVFIDNGMVQEAFNMDMLIAAGRWDLGASAVIKKATGADMPATKGGMLEIGRPSSQYVSSPAEEVRYK